MMNQSVYTRTDGGDWTVEYNAETSCEILAIKPLDLFSVTSLGIIWYF